jgi:hypothetical protein
MARKQYGHNNARQRPGLTDCAGCGASRAVQLRWMESADGMSGGGYHLCQHCYAQYRQMSTPAARDRFLNCLHEEFLLRLSERS